MDMLEEEFVSEVFAVKGTKIKPLITMENNYHLHEYIRKLNVKKGESEDIEYSEIELTKEEITEIVRLIKEGKFPFVEEYIIEGELEVLKEFFLELSRLFESSLKWINSGWNIFYCSPVEDFKNNADDYYVYEYWEES